MEDAYSIGVGSLISDYSQTGCEPPTGDNNPQINHKKPAVTLRHCKLHCSWFFSFSKRPTMFLQAASLPGWHGAASTASANTVGAPRSHEVARWVQGGTTALPPTGIYRGSEEPSLPLLPCSNEAEEKNVAQSKS